MQTTDDMIDTEAQSQAAQDGDAMRPPEYVFKRAIAQPLPAFWPTPSLPIGTATLLSSLATPDAFAATQAAEHASWAKLLAPHECGPRTPVKRGKGKARMKDVHREREEFEQANWAGEKCKCGKVRSPKPRTRVHHLVTKTPSPSPNPRQLTLVHLLPVFRHARQLGGGVLGRTTAVLAAADLRAPRTRRGVGRHRGAAAPRS